MPTRTNKINLVVGGRGTGKTTFIKGDNKIPVTGIIDQYLLLDHTQKILIIDTFDNPVWRDIPIMHISQLPNWKSGVYRLFGSNIKDILASIEKYVYNTVLIFEDATKFIKHKLDEPTEKFIIDSKQKNIDAFFLFHYLMAVPRDLTRIADWLHLFKTNEIFDSNLRSKYPHPDIAIGFENVRKNSNRFYHQSINIGG